MNPEAYQWFQTVDTDRSGFINLKELKQALVNSNWSAFNDETCLMMISESLSERECIATALTLRGVPVREGFRLHLRKQLGKKGRQSHSGENKVKKRDREIGGIV